MTDAKSGGGQKSKPGGKLSGRSVFFVFSTIFLGIAVVSWLFPEQVLGDLPTHFEGAEELVRIGIAGILFGSVFIIRFALPLTPAKPVSPYHTDPKTATDNLRGTDSLETDVDSLLAQIRAEHTAYESEHEQLTEQLREVAIQTLAYYEDISTADAENQLEIGTWTDNGRAAALFLRPERRTYKTRVRLWLSPRETYRRQVEAVISELGAMSRS